MGRFINEDAYATTGQGIVGNNMFTYCLNNPIMGIDSDGQRTYFINGINNEEESDAPGYAVRFAEALHELGVEDVRLIPVYNSQNGIPGTLKGVGQVGLEMLNCDVYSNRIVDIIVNDLQEHPLAEGEQLNIIGYSGGGQLALNVAEKLSVQVDNVILIGTPCMEIFNSKAKISLIYSALDPLSWNLGFGFSSYSAGWVGHTGYFNKSHIGNTASIVHDLIQ